MCRNIRTLFNFDPPATDEEVQAASLQFVRKICGFAKPSKANAEAFDRAVDEVSRIAQDLLAELVTTGSFMMSPVEEMGGKVTPVHYFAPGAEKAIRWYVTLPGVGIWLVPIGALLLFYGIARFALDLSRRR